MFKKFLCTFIFFLCGHFSCSLHASEKLDETFESFSAKMRMAEEEFYDRCNDFKIKLENINAVFYVPSHGYYLRSDMKTENHKPLRTKERATKKEGKIKEVFQFSQKLAELLLVFNNNIVSQKEDLNRKPQAFFKTAITQDLMTYVSKFSYFHKNHDPYVHYYSELNNFVNNKVDKSIIRKRNLESLLSSTQFSLKLKCNEIKKTEELLLEDSTYDALKKGEDELIREKTLLDIKVLALHEMIEKINFKVNMFESLKLFFYQELCDAGLQQKITRKISSDNNPLSRTGNNLFLPEI